MGRKRSRSGSLHAESPPTREASPDVKIAHLDAFAAPGDNPFAMNCLLPPHKPLTFTSIQDYETHYQKTHVNRCSECHKNFPDAHMLNLHIQEYHDPISAAKRDRGEKTYACLVPDCDRLCSTPQKRRLHCIDKHQFPRLYDFVIIKDGIDGRTSMLIPAHRRRSSTVTSTTSEAGTTTAAGRSRASMGGVDAMDLVRDRGEKENANGEASDEDEDGDGQGNETKRSPVQLRGRGGFGRGQGRGRGQHATPASPSKAPTASDPMDGLTASMSTLQFVPRNIQMARGRGRGKQ